MRALALSPAELMRRHAQGLTKLLSDNAKACVREVKFESYFGRKVAIDASMHIYQFMVLARREHSTCALGAFAPRRSARPRARSLRAQAVVGRQGDMQLTNEAGEVTRCVLHSAKGARARWLTRACRACSHLQGMFSRTVRILDAGIRPMCAPAAAWRAGPPARAAPPSVCADKCFGVFPPATFSTASRRT